MTEPDICLSSTPIPIDRTDKMVIDIGNRLKRDVEKLLKKLSKRMRRVGRDDKRLRNTRPDTVH